MPLEDILVCYHDDGDNCQCRKPLPGLIFEASEMWDIDVQSSFMIGDRWKDIEAGGRAKCKTVWLDHSYSEDTQGTVADHYSRSLSKAVEWILSLEEK